MPFAKAWMLNNAAVLVERAPDNGRALSLAHATYPYVWPWDPGGIAAATELVRIAGDYLNRVRDKFEFPPELVVDPADGRIANHAPSRLQLSWMPIEGSPPGGVPAHGRDPRNSFWVQRVTQGGPTTDLGLVLLAVPSLLPNAPATAIGSRMGLRVTARVLRRPNAQWLVGISGSACSAGLLECVGPAGPEVSAALIAFLGGDFKNNAKNKLRAQAGMEPASPLFIEGFRVLNGSGDEANLEIYAHVPRGQGPSGTFAYSITATASVSAAGAIDIEAFRREPIVAHQLNVNLLQQDPPSAAGQHTIAESRANRSPLELAPFAVPTVLPGLPPGPGPKLLVDDLGQVEVRESDLLNGDPTVVHTATAPPRDPRSDDFSALSTYMHARGLLDRMRAYGFVPDAYFQFARFPVIVRYRTTIPTAPRDDGRTVNAAVDYDPPRADFGQGWGPPDLREPLQIRYALGDVKRSAGPAPRRHALLNPAPDREPLGIAADPRWSWHEFGHLLLAASTGGLELPFVHSVGDALAAIACDPDSRLADAHLNGEYRGLTFPWVHAGRRHDRDPYLGWSWCGTYHRPLRFPPYTNNAQRKGYHSEQILSSSLFRLYRALGGDTVDAAGNPDQAARLRAADYVIYLIMRAIHELPPAVAGAAETAQQFMEGLVRADVNTLPAVGGPLDRRVGGWAHKVIRWAFEAQGLDRNVPDDVINNAPGRPENVDLFIDTRRPNAQGPFTRGGYVPVSLHWGGPVQQLWLALNTLQGMQVTPQGLRVRVRNRVGSAVNNVRVRAWSARAQPNLPDWDPAAWAGPTLVWSELGNSPSPQLNVPAGGRLFGPFINLPAQPGRYVLLAAILSAQDEPNINPGAVFPVPTAFNPTPLVDLVAGDNNLGLLVYDVP